MIRMLLTTAAALIPAAVNAEPLSVTTAISVEQRVVARDGSVRFVAQPAHRAAPGDRVTVILAWRNGGAAALAGVILSNPVPAGLVLRDAGAADLSLDGNRFAPLAALRVATAAGERAATSADAVAVRWRLSGAVPPGSSGTFSFRATVK